MKLAIFLITMCASSVVCTGLFFKTQTKNQKNTTMEKTNATATKYGMTGKFRAKPGQAEKLADILLEASRQVSAVKGIRVYAIGRDPKDENVIHVMEIWDSKEDHDQSLTLPETRALISQAMPLIDGKPEGVALEMVGGLGVD
ncbi:putative quinol monooxygenase [Parachryseolinea silvisoli]|jgi:quinol monooxygenase YgiN|uniref:putative quinol monooxygenase n=1 Tax=Parachryseolinea silvisoli TaxID=2873601 RepID=UPI002265D3DC|nr:putative quinol monooxygenase [Parachryseolinea silvisoli]MCD9018617.1 antibiotic biosynthesis monooxygenase [Parachryseolinea silvisoli]